MEDWRDFFHRMLLVSRRLKWAPPMTTTSFQKGGKKHGCLSSIIIPFKKETTPITDPWDWYIYLHIYHQNQPSMDPVNIPTSPMDLMGRPITAAVDVAALRSILSTSRRGMEIISCCACCFVLAPIHNRKPRKVLRSKLSDRVSVVFCLFEMVSSSIFFVFFRCINGDMFPTKESTKA